MTVDDVDHVGRRLRTLEQCALHRRTIRLTCPECGRVRRLDAVALWWLFSRRGWDDGLPEALRRFCCEVCRRTGGTVRPRHLVTREHPDEQQFPYPDRHVWRRLVSRHRS